jgi:hypothetical protein
MRKISRRPASLTICGLVLAALAFGSIPAESFGQVQPRPKPSPKPSLDALVLRVNAYWSLLGKGDKSRALDYVAQASRNDFLTRTAPPFSSPRISGLELSTPEEVKVTVTVRRHFPEMPALADWQVSEKWIFRGGNWFAVIPANTSMFGFNANSPGQKPPPALSSEEIEKRRNEIQGALQFEDQKVDFGTIRKGKTASFQFKYRLAGKEPMNVRFEGVPADIEVLGLTDRKLQPGDHELQMQWLTDNYDGPIHEDFRIFARYRDVELPYSFTVGGMVYSPVSSLPMQALFLRDESQKELTIKNNSQSDVRITRYTCQSGNFRLSSLPILLHPGDQSVITIREVNNTGQKNFQDMLSLGFEQTVEGMASLIIPIIANYEKPPEDKRFLGLSQKEIDDLRQKAKQNPIKP